MSKNKNIRTIQKDDFIKFLSTSTPEEINEYILEKGKPKKLIDPIIFFDNAVDNNNDGKVQ